MLISKVGDFAAARRAAYKALFNEKRLVNLFHSASVLANSGGNGGNADRAALELVDDGEEYFIVDFVQAVFIYIERFEGEAGNGEVNAAVAAHLCKVAHAAQQGVGDTGRTSAAPCYLVGRTGLYGHAEYVGGASDDVRQRGGIVVFEVEVDAETSTERGSEQAAARGSTHEREGVEVYLYRTRRRAAVDHDVDTVVLHCGVEIFLHHGGEAVNLVDEEHIVLFEARKQARQVARLVKHGTRG